MSTLYPSRVSCARCAADVPVVLADSLSVERMPQARALVLERRLHRFTCGACGRALIVAKPVLYTDRALGLWVACVPEAERPRYAEHEEAALETFRLALHPSNAPPVARELFKDSVPRIAFGYEELREHVVAAERGLDLPVVEVLKLEVLTQHPALIPRHGALALVLDGVEEDGAVRFVAVLPSADAGVGPVRVRREAWEQLMARREALAPARPGLFTRPWVNLLRYRYAPHPVREAPAEHLP